ncbi:hypothetical protein ES705_16855 [subsurface metagenome]
MLGRIPGSGPDLKFMAAVINRQGCNVGDLRVGQVKEAGQDLQDVSGFNTLSVNMKVVIESDDVPGTVLIFKPHGNKPGSYV